MCAYGAKNQITKFKFQLRADLPNLILAKVTHYTVCNAIMQDEIGETALHAASRNGHVNVITVLVQRGADVNFLTKVGGVRSSIVEDGMLSLEAYTACG